MSPLSMRPRGAALATILVLVLLAGTAAAGWYAWQQWLAFNDAQAQNTQSQAQAMAALEERLAAERKHLDDAVNALGASVAENSDGLRNLQAGGQRDWLLNEAAALASLAQQRLLLTADLDAARRLLSAASETLARISDPAVLPARRASAGGAAKAAADTVTESTKRPLRSGNSSVFSVKYCLYFARIGKWGRREEGDLDGGLARRARHRAGDRRRGLRPGRGARRTRARWPTAWASIGWTTAEPRRRSSTDRGRTSIGTRGTWSRPWVLSRDLGRRWHALTQGERAPPPARRSRSDSELRRSGRPCTAG